MNPAHRGFTLVEALLTLFLLSLVMVVVSGLTSTLRRAHGVSDKRNELFEARSMAIHTIKEETQAAVTIVRPASASPDKLQTRRFPAASLIPKASPARLVWPKLNYFTSWSPKDNAHLADVRIELVGDALIHHAVDGTSRTLLLARKFQARQTEPGFYEFAIELKTDSAAKTPELSLKVSRW